MADSKAATSGVSAQHESGVHEPVRHHRVRNTRVAKRARLFRARLNLRPRLLLAYKIVVGVVGLAVLVVGIVDIPLPGPGWLIVFLGLAILGTEFPLAHRFNMWVQRKLHEFWARFRAWRARRAERRAAARSTGCHDGACALPGAPRAEGGR